MTRRQRVYRALNPEARLTATSRMLVILIVAATGVAILETEPLIAFGREREFRLIELSFALIFGVEYAARLWSAAEGPTSRLRYALSPASLVDLIVVIGALLPFVASDILILRLLRVIRIIRIAKLGRFSRAFSILERAVKSRASQLWVASLLAILFLIVSGTIIYLVEGPGQPDKFGSIPRSMWWAVSTMTTVGYGDVIPSTPLGKIVASLVSISGIVLIAIPTGIMAAAFSDEMHSRREDETPARPD